jgi:transposase-like protein
VLSGLRGEDSIAELCRREGIVQNLYYRWSKEFLEAGKKRLAGDTARAATSDEVKDLRREASALKEAVGDCQEFRAEVGHDRSKGARQCRDARNLAYLIPCSISCWRVLTPRPPSTRTG